MKKYIATTTINPPTEALIKYSKLKDWTVIVAGDLKTPPTLSILIWLANCPLLIIGSLVIILKSKTHIFILSNIIILLMYFLLSNIISSSDTL